MTRPATIHPTTSSLSDITDEDFKIFWKWLTTTRGSRRQEKERAENVNIRRVFITLGMFKSELDMVEFMRTWNCENEHTVKAPELKEALQMLDPLQFQTLSRFLAALRKKDNEEKEKEIERQKFVELERKKREQQKKARARRMEKSKSRQIFGKRLMKRARRMSIDEEDDEEEIGQHTKNEAAEIKAFKDKYGLNKDERKMSFRQRFVSYIRSLSGPSNDSKKVLPITLKSKSLPFSRSISSFSFSSSNNNIVHDGDVGNFDAKQVISRELMSPDNDDAGLEIDDSLISFTSSFIESECSMSIRFIG